ncbi:MAG: hypothetical protein PVS2B2_11450 [Candidatus Acidiferrum sp.]
MERLEDGFDFGIEGDVSYGSAADGVGSAFSLREMEEAADVIVLIITGEDTLDFVWGKGERRKGDGLAIFTGESGVTINEFAKGEHGSAASGFGGHNQTPRAECTADGKKKETILRGEHPSKGKTIANREAAKKDEEMRAFVACGRDWVKC